MCACQVCMFTTQALSESRAETTKLLILDTWLCSSIGVKHPL